MGVMYAILVRSRLELPLTVDLQASEYRRPAVPAIPLQAECVTFSGGLRLMMVSSLSSNCWNRTKIGSPINYSQPLLPNLRIP